MTDTLARLRRVGLDVPRSALIAALHTGGVQKVNLISPAADVEVPATGAAFASSITITLAGFEL